MSRELGGAASLCVRPYGSKRDGVNVDDILALILYVSQSIVTAKIGRVACFPSPPDEESMFIPSGPRT
jgi:hypothetical protein